MATAPAHAWPPTSRTLLSLERADCSWPRAPKLSVLITDVAGIMRNKAFTQPAVGSEDNPRHSKPCTQQIRTHNIELTQQRDKPGKCLSAPRTVNVGAGDGKLWHARSGTICNAEWKFRSASQGPGNCCAASWATTAKDTGVSYMPEGSNTITAMKQPGTCVFWHAAPSIMHDILASQWFQWTPLVLIYPPISQPYFAILCRACPIVCSPIVVTHLSWQISRGL